MNSKCFGDTEQALLEQVMLHRRDIRGNNFLSDPVSPKDIQTILNAAVLAPSVGFSQPWEFVVIEDKGVRESVHDSFIHENNRAKPQFKVEKQDLYESLKLEGILEAPVNIAVFYKPNRKPILGQTTMKSMGEYSVVCAVQNMWLMARALNIGIGWVSILDPDRVKELLKAPEDRVLVAYLCVGHVKAFADSPELERLKWEKRKALDSLIFKDGYGTF